MTKMQKTERIVMNPYAILTAVMGIVGMGGTVGYDHVMEKFWHPINARLDKMLVHQKVLIYLGNTEEEIEEAWHKASVEVYEEKVMENMSNMVQP